MITCDYRLVGFAMLLLAGFYATSRLNCIRFALTNFRRSDVNRKSSAEKNAPTSHCGNPACSFDVFRDYLRRTRSNYLPGAGVWKRRGGRLERFQPDLCSLTYGSWVPRDRLARCFTRFNLSYLVILGDSNALRLYKVVRRTLSAAGTLPAFDCAVDRRHGDVITPDLPVRRCLPYYTPLRHFLPPSYFRCKLTVSGGAAIAPLLVQYLPVTGDAVPLRLLFDRKATGCVDSNTSRVVQTQAATIQDFLFGEYFSASLQPDVVLYMSSSWEQDDLPVYSQTVDRFVSMLRRHSSQLPSRTRLIVVSRPDEYLPLKPESWRRRRYQPGNVTRTEWITASNRVFHARLVPLFVDHEFVGAGGPRLMLFPDIAAAMRPVLDELAVDGVHSSTFWYKTLWSYIAQTICATNMH